MHHSKIRPLEDAVGLRAKIMPFVTNDHAVGTKLDTFRLANWQSYIRRAS